MLSGSPIIVTGNTSALRGKADFAGFASTKAAQRILSESIARDLGPRGIHVAYVLIDAVIDVPRMRERLPEVPEEFFIKPPLSPTNFGTSTTGIARHGRFLRSFVRSGKNGEMQTALIARFLTAVSWSSQCAT